jgi:glyoxylase-like metal-dependent hydrolase (beta-lactamase superfamily II)
VHLDKREAAFWLNRGNARFVPKAAQSSFQVATAALHPYASEGKVKLFDGNAQLLPGITAIAAHGQHPGHTLYSFESKATHWWLGATWSIARLSTCRAFGRHAI